MCISGEFLRANFQNIACICRLAATALEDIKRRNRRALLKQSTPGDPKGGGQDSLRTAVAAAAAECPQRRLDHDAQLERVLRRTDREKVLCVPLGARYTERLLAAASWARHVRHVVVERHGWEPRDLWASDVSELRLLVRALARCCDGLETVVIKDSGTLHTEHDGGATRAANALAVARYAVAAAPPGLRRHTCLARLDLFFTIRGKKAPVYKLLTGDLPCAWCSAEEAAQAV